MSRSGLRCRACPNHACCLPGWRPRLPRDSPVSTPTWLRGPCRPGSVSRCTRPTCRPIGSPGPRRRSGAPPRWPPSASTHPTPGALGVDADVYRRVGGEARARARGGPPGRLRGRLRRAARRGGGRARGAGGGGAARAGDGRLRRPDQEPGGADPRARAADPGRAAGCMRPGARGFRRDAAQGERARAGRRHARDLRSGRRGAGRGTGAARAAGRDAARRCPDGRDRRRRRTRVRRAALRHLRLQRLAGDRGCPSVA